MKRNILITLTLTSLILLSSCSSSKEGKNDTEGTREKTYIERYEDGLKAFENKKYYQSIEDFNFVVFNAPGSDIADDAQFYLASANLEMKEYLVAIEEFQSLLRRWPASDLYEEARFKIAECYFMHSPGYQRDQESIDKAILSYQDFIDEYPFSDKRPNAEARIKELRTGLAKKIYEAGNLYMVLREWNAAIVTFQEILDSYYDTSIINDTYLDIATSQSKLNRREEMINALSKVNKDALSATKLLHYNNLMKLSLEWPE